MMIGRLLSALLFCAAGSALAEGVEGGEGGVGVGGWGVTLRYDFLYNGFKVGDVTEVFRADAGGGYVLESHAAATHRLEERRNDSFDDAGEQVG